MEIKLFKKEKTFTKNNFWFNFDLYWKISIVLLFGFILWASFFGYSLFMAINQDSAVLDASAGSQSAIVKKDRIDKVLEHFSLRKEKSDQIINSGSVIIDPSL